jgi:hypothetical protein
LRLRRIATACRLPDFAVARREGAGDVRAYVQSVVSGSVTDRTLTPLLRYGLRFVEVIEGFMDDPESGNAAALLEAEL